MTTSVCCPNILNNPSFQDFELQETSTTIKMPSTDPQRGNRKLKYAFSSNKARAANRKGAITETLVRQHIESELIPSLKREGWDFVFFVDHLESIIPYDDLPPEKRPHQQGEKFFISKELFPSSEFLEYLRRLDGLIEGQPDGFLIKFKRTGKAKLVKEALQEFRLFGKEGFVGQSKRVKDEQIPIVNGEIDLLEVKSGEAHFQSSQRKNYIKIVKSGYTLRYFHVQTVSPTKHQFEITQQVITDANEI